MSAFSFVFLKVFNLAFFFLVGKTLKPKLIRFFFPESEQWNYGVAMMQHEAETSKDVKKDDHQYHTKRSNSNKEIKNVGMILVLTWLLFLILL